MESKQKRYVGMTKFFTFFRLLFFANKKYLTSLSTPKTFNIFCGPFHQTVHLDKTFLNDVVTRLNHPKNKLEYNLLWQCVIKGYDLGLTGRFAGNVCQSLGLAV